MTRFRTSRVRAASQRDDQQGVIIVLVAVFMLFVVGAMAALSIDVVTLYTARSEAQLVADAAALAGARTLANSGMTSNPLAPGLIAAAEGLALKVANQVGGGSTVGGRSLNTSSTVCGAAEISVCFNDSDASFDTDPHVTVKVQRADLPTFFSRLLGNTQLKVAASATAEAYNPSGTYPGVPTIPVAPLCVKPWLLPNIDPVLGSGTAIFDSVNGTIVNPGLVGKSWPWAAPGANTNGLYSLPSTSPPSAGQYYAGTIDATDFLVPTSALPACSAGFMPYQLAVAGCVPQPIACGAPANASINIDMVPDPNRDTETVAAAQCLIHGAAAGDSDSIDTVSPIPPFQFLGGNQNPVSSVVGKDSMVSDSLVTVPVYDSSAGGAPTNPVNVIGFVQLFLNPSATTALPQTYNGTPNQIPVTIINIVGCGTGATGTPVIGNGASPVAVRLISGP